MVTRKGKDEIRREISEACATEDYESVRALCNQAIQHDMHDADLFFLRGLSYVHDGSFDEAIADLSKAIELDPSCPLFYLRRAEVFESVDNFESKLQDLKDGAKIEAQRTVCLSHGEYHHGGEPDHIHVKLANVLWGEVQNQEALAVVASALQLNPQSSHAYALRAALHNHFGYTEQSAVDFARSISLEPNSILPYWLRAQIYMDDSEFEACAEDLSIVISIDPENKFAFFLRSHCHFEMEDYDESILDLNSALELDPDYGNAYYHRGLSFFELGQYENAMADFLACTHRQPEIALWEERGICHAELGSPRSAIIDLTQAIEVGAINEYRALIYRARCFNMLLQHEEALVDADKCILLAVDEPEPYFIRGIANHYLGKLDEAIEDFTTCALKDQWASSVFEQRAKVYENQAKLKEAVDDYTLAIGLDPAFPSPVLLKRGQCFQQLGRLDEAERDLCAFINNQKDNDSAMLLNAHRVRADIRAEKADESGARQDEEEVKKLRSKRFTECSTTPTDQLDKLFDESIMIASEKQDVLADFVSQEFGEDWRYDYNVKDCRMTLSSTKKEGLSRKLQLLGRKSFDLDMRILATVISSKQEWLWAWANSYTPPVSSETSRALLELGQLQNVEELLIDSPFITDGELSNKLKVIGSVFCDADALFVSTDEDLVTFFLVRAPFLKLRPWAGTLEQLYFQYKIVIDTQPITNARLALTSYLDKRKIGYTCDWESVRINGPDKQYLLFTYDKGGALLESERCILEESVR
ncbi:MAG: tetratricopeptide repeat protein [Candidatus Obscuribacterales bacterium]|nr:tetratricopeptide repeat protein [Candidatus Obscuribacterales bacterium]